MVYMLLADGFEETEAVAPLDILRRAGVEIATVSLMSDLPVRSRNGVVVQADIMFDRIDFELLEMLILPGGAGVALIADSPAAMDLIKRTWEEGKKLAAICAAPSLLAKLDFLHGKRVVCHPSVIDEVKAAGGIPEPGFAAVRDENLVTGKAAGASIEFGLKLAAVLCGEEVSEEIRRDIHYAH